MLQEFIIRHHKKKINSYLILSSIMLFSVYLRDSGTELVFHLELLGNGWELCKN